MRTSIVLVVLAAAVAVATSGCARKHLTPEFGTANREAFLAQRARAPNQPAPRPNMVLDSQETSVISESYVRGLAGKAAASREPEPMLYVAPQQPGGAPQRLAPSVPRE